MADREMDRKELLERGRGRGKVIMGLHDSGKTALRQCHAKDAGAIHRARAPGERAEEGCDCGRVCL